MAALSASLGFLFKLRWNLISAIMLVVKTSMMKACTLQSSQTFPSPQVKTDVAKEVAAARRKQHLSSLQYYCALNALQYRKRAAMMEPLIGFAHGQVGEPLPTRGTQKQSGEMKAS